jgi:hypothetical protein
MEDKFEIIEEVNRQYQCFNAEGTQVKVRLLPPPSPSPDDDDDDDQNITNPVTHFETSMDTLFDYALRNVVYSDKVVLVIHDENTGHKDKPIGFSFRCKDQLSHEVIWRPFEKVVQFNSRFNALGPLSTTVHYIKMPVGNGGVKTKGRRLNQLAHDKTSIVTVKAK